MLTALSVFCMSVLGFAALALAMDRHHEQFARRWRGPSARWVMRLAGAACLASSLLCAVLGSGWPLGILLWLGWLTPAALAVTAFIACRPASARKHPQRR